ncbi:MAG: glycoside hydrolase family 3 C-terminal domain-containing protein [Saccharofermentanales bacterium]
MIKAENILKYKKRAEEIVGRMTLEEKVLQMEHTAPGIPRLGIKGYNWWNEALHGVARAGVATVFPQAIAMAATFDADLIFTIGDAISTEGRAKYNEFQRQNDYGIYKGLTFWSPNINIFRDPRWGRGHETYGEDPYLTGVLGVAFVKGIQGDDEAYLKAAACVKHYAAHSGPEASRHGFDSKVSIKDFYETYTPAFRRCVAEAHVEAVMGAYNSVNGELCCASAYLIQEVLRDGFGFDGHFVSDCGAISDIYTAHHAVPTYGEAVALSVRSGCDLNCGSAFMHLLGAVEDGFIDEATIDRSLVRLITTRLKLGNIDGADCRYNLIPFSENNSRANNALSLEAAKKCLTLLDNDGILPLARDRIRTIAVIGPNAASRTVLEGNYCGTAIRYHTILDGIRDFAGEEMEVLYAQGCHLFRDRVEPCSPAPDDRLSEALAVAQRADVVVLCIGLDPSIEGEEGDAFNGEAAGDKVDLELPGLQNSLISAICKVNPNVIIVNLSGSAVNLADARDNARSVIQAWYPGAYGGIAVAELLFGGFSPSGKLPVTFYKSVEDLPPFDDYSMDNRTYRYFSGEPLYPFGYGLSYTTFRYSGLASDKSSIHAGDSVCCSVRVVNTGTMDSDEVVQLYLRDDAASVPSPRHQLKGFRRIHLLRGESRVVEFRIVPEDMELVLDDGTRVIEPGSFTVFIGGGQPGPESTGITFEVC